MKYIYLGKSLELLWAVWVQFSVRYVLVLACTCSQCLQLLLKCTVSAQLKDFNLLHLLLLGPFPLLFFGWVVLCLQVSSFWSLPWYQRGLGEWSLTWAHFLRCAVEKERNCKQTPLACVGSAWSGWNTQEWPQPKAAWTSQVQAPQAPRYAKRAQVGCASPQGLSLWHSQ